MVQMLNASVYAMQYPNYGTYIAPSASRVSDKIKENALEFYDYISNGKNKQKTIIIGRSIGTGGATFLASRKQIPNLILVSPFSNIKEVGKDFVGCVGCLVKQHFNNVEELTHYHGNLLVIHGKMDEVINHRHGVLVRDTYNQTNKGQGKFCTFIQPADMTHNYFSYEEDILKPIKEFVQKVVKN